MRPQLALSHCLVSATLLTLVVGCGSEPIVVAPEAPKVTVMHPEQRELSDHEEFNGWMAADESVEVRSRVRGHIKKIHFTDGQYVKKGDLLFELDPRPFQAEIDRMREQLEGLRSTKGRRRQGGSATADAANRKAGQAFSRSKKRKPMRLR